MLLDLDGTLANTLPDLADALNVALAESGLEAVSEQTLRPLVSQGARVMAERAITGQVDEALLDGVRDRFLEFYRSNVARRTRLVAGMHEVIDGLESRNLDWGIVTNKLHAFTDPLLQALGIQHRAACIVCGDSTANAKPHPQPLLHACRQTNSKPAHCIYVGDARKDVEAGRRAGMRTVVALYGYIAADEDPMTWGASAVIRKPEELLVWIDEVNRDA